MDLMSRDKDGKGGVIVNISSIAGLEPMPFWVTYSAAKFGIVGFTRSLGQEMIYNKTGVKLMTICPGATETAIYNTAGTSILTFPWMFSYGDQLCETFKTQNYAENIEILYGFLCLKHIHGRSRPEAVGKAVAKIITDGDNGSVWIASEDQIIPVTFQPNKFLAKM
uniref:Alcohol dehydrogenase 2 n=3 Tax=Culex pipiens TaxID=7175 RepID=A0A8D8P9J0_CULPI